MKNLVPKITFLLGLSIVITLLRAVHLKEGNLITIFTLLPVMVLVYPVLYIEEYWEFFMVLRNLVLNSSYTREIVDDSLLDYHIKYSTVSQGGNFEIELQKYIQYLELHYRDPFSHKKVRKLFKNYYGHAIKSIRNSA